MNYKIITTGFGVALCVAFALAAAPAFASETTGTLTTGIGTNVDGTVITAPSASPAAGTYTSAQSVTLAAAGSQSIRYTTDGSAPTCASGLTYATVSPISVGSSLTIKALSCYPNNGASAVASFAYTINPPTTGGGTTGTTGGNNSTNPPPPPGGGGGGGNPLPPPNNLTLSQRADINRDGRVDLLDFNLLMVGWGQTGAGIAADVNLDNSVGLLDFNPLMIYWTL